MAHLLIYYAAYGAFLLAGYVASSIASQNDQTRRIVRRYADVPMSEWPVFGRDIFQAVLREALVRRAHITGQDVVDYVERVQKSDAEPAIADYAYYADAFERGHEHEFDVLQDDGSYLPGVLYGQKQLSRNLKKELAGIPIHTDGRTDLLAKSRNPLDLHTINAVTGTQLLP